MSTIYSRKCNDCINRVVDDFGVVKDCNIKLFGNSNCKGYSIDKSLYDTPPKLTLEEAKVRIKLMYKSTNDELSKTKISSILSILDRVE